MHSKHDNRARVRKRKIWKENTRKYTKCLSTIALHHITFPTILVIPLHSHDNSLLGRTNSTILIEFFLCTRAASSSSSGIINNKQPLCGVENLFRKKYSLFIPSRCASVYATLFACMHTRRARERARAIAIKIVRVDKVSVPFETLKIIRHTDKREIFVNGGNHHKKHSAWNMILFIIYFHFFLSLVCHSRGCNGARNKVETKFETHSTLVAAARSMMNGAFVCVLSFSRACRTTTKIKFHHTKGKAHTNAHWQRSINKTK
jgi:hypothetical protein